MFWSWQLADLVTVYGAALPELVAHNARDPPDPRFDRDSVVTDVAAQAL